ncbi:MAG TPA: glycosyl hydrolase family 28-related protein, partial [Steroidobacteraceae bacterium]|nr:glycosyl hydrolase family 28-related protein [Steroidobacteraceae bacterium]
MLAISGPLAMLVTVASVTARNLPAPGAYQAIPNFTGVGAVLQFRQTINDGFSGAQRVAPAIATVSFANLPLEQDGTILYCQDCKISSPCVGTGTGAWALGAHGQWSCASGPLEASLNANGNKLTNLANGTVSGDALDFGQSAGSDLSGTLPNPIVQTVLGSRRPHYRSEPNASLNDSALSTIGAATTAIGQPAANMTLNKPSTVVSGNTMIMAYYAQSASAPTPPPGWTLIRSDSCAGGALGSYYKVADGREPSSYTWTSPTAYYAAALIDVGVTAADPVDKISPTTCGPTPSVSGLTTTNQAENVVIFGAAVNSNVRRVGFSRGSLAVVQDAVGVIPLSVGYLTGNYSTTPLINVSGSGAALAVQMIAIAPSGTHAARAVLQGDSYAELTTLDGTAGGNDSINNFNMNGDFNVKNPIYGAKGNGLTDDTASIQAAFNAACAQGALDASSETLFFPKGTYITSFPILSNCSTPINFVGESENTAIIKAENSALFPIIMHEGSSYLANMKSAAGGSLTGTSLATGAGHSLVWGATSEQYYDLEDAENGVAAYGLNGASAWDIQGFLNYAGGGSGTIYIAQSNGNDLNLPNMYGALQLYLVTGSLNKLEGCITTTGSGSVCTMPGGSISANTTYEFEWSYDGAHLRVFEGIPGNTVTLAGSVAATGTIVQA